MGVKSARRRGRRRAQSQRAPARRDEVDAQAERRFGRLAKGGGSAAARAAEERLVAEADAQDQCGQRHYDRGRWPVEAWRFREKEPLHPESRRVPGQPSQKDGVSESCQAEARWREAKAGDQRNSRQGACPRARAEGQPRGNPSARDKPGLSQRPRAEERRLPEGKKPGRAHAAPARRESGVEKSEGHDMDPVSAQSRDGDAAGSQNDRPHEKESLPLTHRRAPSSREGEATGGRSRSPRSRARRLPRAPSRQTRRLQARLPPPEER